MLIHGRPESRSTQWGHLMVPGTPGMAHGSWSPCNPIPPDRIGVIQPTMQSWIPPGVPRFAALAGKFLKIIIIFKVLRTFPAHFFYISNSQFWWFSVASGRFFDHFRTPGAPEASRVWSNIYSEAYQKIEVLVFFFLPCLTILVHALPWVLGKIWSPYCACGFLFSRTIIKNCSGENELSIIIKLWKFDPCFPINVIFPKI